MIPERAQFQRPAASCRAAAGLGSCEAAATSGAGSAAWRAWCLRAMALGVAVAMAPKKDPAAGVRICAHRLRSNVQSNDISGDPHTTHACAVHRRPGACPVPRRVPDEAEARSRATPLRQSQPAWANLLRPRWCAWVRATPPTGSQAPRSMSRDAPRSEIACRRCWSGTGVCR